MIGVIHSRPINVSYIIFFGELHKRYFIINIVMKFSATIAYELKILALQENAENILTKIWSTM